MNRFGVLLTIVISILPVRQTIVLRDPGGLDTVTFPSGSFSEDEIRTIMRLSPNLRMSNSYPVMNSIEMCIKGEPAYKGCGTEAAHNKWFAENANVNIKKMQTALKELDKISNIEKLSEIVQYERTLQRFYIEIERARLEFKLNHQPSILEKPIEGIDPQTQCSESIVKVKTARSQEAADEVVRMDWYNCLNSKMRQQVGPYPDQVWLAFLQKSNIQEVYSVNDE